MPSPERNVATYEVVPPARSPVAPRSRVGHVVATATHEVLRVGAILHEPAHSPPRSVLSVALAAPVQQLLLRGASSGTAVAAAADAIHRRRPPPSVRGAPSAAAAAAAAVRRPPAAARRLPSAAAAAVAPADYITQTPDRPPHVASSLVVV